MRNERNSANTANHPQDGKGSPVSALQAIRNHQGEQAGSPGGKDLSYEAGIGIQAILHPLTSRYEVILELVAQGMTNRDISKFMGTTEQTIKNCVRVLMDKTGMDSRLQMALWYVHRVVTAEKGELPR